MSRMNAMDLSFFVLESGSRPMHAGAVMLFDPPEDERPEDLVERTMAAFRAAEPVAPWNRRPVLGLGSLPHWETVAWSDIDVDHHVRRITLPAPGTMVELMALVSHLYPAPLDHSRPLWEAYVIDGVEGGRMAIFMKGHHSLADGVGGMRMFYASLSETPNDDPRPLWTSGPPRRARRDARDRDGGIPLIGEAVKQTTKLVGAIANLIKALPETARLAAEAGPPSPAAKLPMMAARISPARSFAAFDLPLDEVKRIGKQFSGTVNDVVLSICDAAMHRYVAETGATIEGRLVAQVAVSTRRDGDDSANAVTGALIKLGQPDATPAERLSEVVATTTKIKSQIRRSPSLVLQLRFAAIMGGSELREQLPVGRGTVPHLSSFTVSNIPASPKRLYLGRAELSAMYAVPIVPGGQAANFTLVNTEGKLCVGVGAARNIISDTGRLAELSTNAFEDLRASTPAPARTRKASVS
jgi:diacylglycerol O-acyltransferase / wax synthase